MAEQSIINEYADDLQSYLFFSVPKELNERICQIVRELGTVLSEEQLELLCEDVIKPLGDVIEERDDLRREDEYDLGVTDGQEVGYHAGFDDGYGAAMKKASTAKVQLDFNDYEELRKSANILIAALGRKLSDMDDTTVNDVMHDPKLSDNRKVHRIAWKRTITANRLVLKHQQALNKKFREVEAEKR